MIGSTHFYTRSMAPDAYIPVIFNAGSAAVSQMTTEMLSYASPRRLLAFIVIAGLTVFGVLRFCVCIDYAAVSKHRPYILDFNGWLSIAPFSPPPLLRSIVRLSGFHDEVNAFHVAPRHAPSRFFTENDGGYQTRRGQHVMAAPVATPSISSFVGGALRTKYPYWYMAAYESESVYLSYLFPNRRVHVRYKKESRVNHWNPALV